VVVGFDGLVSFKHLMIFVILMDGSVVHFNQFRIAKFELTKAGWLVRCHCFDIEKFVEIKINEESSAMISLGSFIIGKRSLAIAGMSDVSASKHEINAANEGAGLASCLEVTKIAFRHHLGERNVTF
jgi:hypothetical protein